MSQHRFKCSCGKGKLFKIWVDGESFTNIQCHTCGRMFVTKVMKIEN